MFYDKKIKYLDVYEREQKQQNAGYVKLEARGEEVIIQICANKLRQTDVGQFKVLFRGNGKEVVADEILLEKGNGTVWIHGKNMEVVPGIGYEQLEEICVKLNGDRVLRGIIALPQKQEKIEAAEERSVKETEGTKEIKESPVVTETEAGREDQEAEVEATEQPKASDPGQEEATTIPFEENRHSLQHPPACACKRGQSVTKWQELWKIYPHVRPFGDNREYLKLMPQDFLILSKKYYPLISNSFLCHGFYNYEHLILTRQIRENTEYFYIGVPGNFYDKEKQVAVLFGFESFEGKTEPAKEGDFGYYMISVEL